MRVVHCKREPSTKYIGRGSIYGNPYTRNGYQFVRCTSYDHEGPVIQCIQPSSGIDKLTFDAWNQQS